MKDLYRRIGLSSQTDDLAMIERAIARSRSKDSASLRAARHVLLNPERKTIYDRTHTLLCRIGQLRANLELHRAPNWLNADCSDFDVASTTTEPQINALHERRNSKQNSHRWTGWAVALLALGSLIIFGLLDANRSMPVQRGYTPQVSNDAIERSIERRFDEERAARDLTQQAPVSQRTAATPRVVDIRAERLRELAKKRMQRAGLVPDPALINAAVQKLLNNQSDPLPPTGIIRKSFYGQGVAPLEIKTAYGSNYFIKVVDWRTKSEVLTAFIQGGQPFETTIPVGSYEIRYAAGQNWYGPILDFGTDAIYRRCDDRFDFTEDNRGYSGYTIELILQQYGNLQTDPMSADDF